MAEAIEEGGVRWWLGRGITPATARPRLRRALAALEAGAANLKRGRRKALYRLDLSGGGQPDHLLKVNAYPDARWRRSKARLELERAEAVMARGIPTPLPLAAGERRRRGRLEACYLLVAIVPGACDLRERLAPGAAGPAERRALARALGELARRLHDGGVHQDDFQPNNFLVCGDARAPELLAIDFERARLGAPVPGRLRRRALAKLDRELARAPASLRLRFLRAYAGGDAADARAWFAAVAREAPALARRDARHLLRNAARPGRRFEAVRLPGYTGVARPGLDPVRLGRALALAPDTADAVRGAPAADEWSVVLARPSLAHARRALARALVLSARGLAPCPLALLCGRERSILVLERAERSLASGELRPNATSLAAVRVLERRLLGYGRLGRPLRAQDVALEPAGPARARAYLIGIEAFALRPPLGIERLGIRPRFDGRAGSAAPAR